MATPGRKSSWALCVVVAATVAATAAPAALGDDRGTASAVLQSQIEFTKQGSALNKCLDASPTKNTPCIRREALKLAALADRHIAAIRAAMDGSEAACIVTVAQQQIAYLKVWRDGARALNRNERKKARRLFVASLAIGAAQEKLQPRCFTEVLLP